MLTITLIDSHPIIRTGLSLFLKNHLNEIIIQESESIFTFIESHSGQAPDLIILGFNKNSDSNNLGLINTAKKSYPTTKIIVYDENSQSNLILDYLRTGVNGYLTKLNNLTDLLDCIADVIKGKRYICNEGLNVLLEKHPVEKVVSYKVNNLLTSREYEIAMYLSEGMKTSMIALKLDRKASTISTTKNNIFKKLEVDNILKLREVIQPEYMASH